MSSEMKRMTRIIEKRHRERFFHVYCDGAAPEVYRQWKVTNLGLRLLIRHSAGSRKSRSVESIRFAAVLQSSASTK